MKTVLALALFLGLGTGVAGAQPPAVSVSGDYGAAESTVTATPGSITEEPAGPFSEAPVARPAAPFDGGVCPPTKLKATIAFARAFLAQPVASLALTARSSEVGQDDG